MMKAIRRAVGRFIFAPAGLEQVAEASEFAVIARWWLL